MNDTEMIGKYLSTTTPLQSQFEIQLMVYTGMYSFDPINAINRSSNYFDDSACIFALKRTVQRTFSTIVFKIST